MDQRESIPQVIIDTLGNAFDNTIYPRVTGLLGQPPQPGIDGSQDRHPDLRLRRSEHIRSLQARGYRAGTGGDPIQTATK